MNNNMENIQNVIQNIIQNVKKMLEYRGYTITNDESDDAVDERASLDNHIVAEKQDDTCITFILASVNNEDFNNIIRYMDENGYSHGILVYSKITSTVQSAYSLIDKKIEIFEHNYFNLVIVEHSYVPKHELVSDTNITKSVKSKFQTIPKTDPVVRFYNYAVGDIIKITRSNSEIVYKVVAN